MADIPNVVVKCTNARCSQSGKEQTVPGAVQVTDTVIATYNLCCAVCGDQLAVISSAP